jgi:hypothetical protein
MCLLQISVSLHIKFVAVAHISEGQFFLREAEERVQFVVLRDATVRQILSVKRGRTFVRTTKAWIKKNRE